MNNYISSLLPLAGNAADVVLIDTHPSTSGVFDSIAAWALTHGFRRDDTKGNVFWSLEQGGAFVGYWWSRDSLEAEIALRHRTGEKFKAWHLRASLNRLDKTATCECQPSWLPDAVCPRHLAEWYPRCVEDATFLYAGYALVPADDLTEGDGVRFDTDTGNCRYVVSVFTRNGKTQIMHSRRTAHVGAVLDQALYGAPEDATADTVDLQVTTLASDTRVHVRM